MQLLLLGALPVAIGSGATAPTAGHVARFSGAITAQGSFHGAAIARFSGTIAAQGFNARSATTAAPLGAPSASSNDRQQLAAPAPAPAAVVAPSVADLTVVRTTSTTVILSWSASAGATEYRVYQGTGGAGYGLIASVAAGITSFTATGLAPGSSYTFEVSAVSVPGNGAFAPKEGMPAGPVTAQTQPGAAPVRLTARLIDVASDVLSENKVMDTELLAQKQLAALEKSKSQSQSGVPTPADASEAAVILMWPAAPEAAGYLVFRDGTPLTQTTSPVAATSFTDEHVPPGAHTYTVASMFKTAANRYVEGQLADLPQANVPAMYGYFSVVLEKLICNQATQDTLLATDGKGDEIYLTIDRDLVAVSGNKALNSLRTWTYGQDLGLVTPDRTAGGSETASGGIKDHDELPLRSGACSATDSEHLCLPAEIFRGALVQGARSVYLVPRAWEWDGLDDSFNEGLESRRKNGFSKVMSEFTMGVAKAGLAQKSRTAAGPGGFIPMPSVSLPVNGAAVSDASLFGSSSPIVTLMLPGAPLTPDRPIGLRSVSRDLAKLQETTQFDDQIIPLSYDLADALVSGRLALPPMRPNEFVITFADTYSISGGVYTLVFRVDKCQSLFKC